MNSVGGPTSFPASPKIALKSPVCLTLRGFLLSSASGQGTNRIQPRHYRTSGKYLQGQETRICPPN